MSILKKRLILASILLIGLLIGGGLGVTGKQTPPKQMPTKNPIEHDQGVLSASNTILETAVVTKVVDGDTIDVSLHGAPQKIRIIGINTPESVDPRRGVQCFGLEASHIAKEKLTGQGVLLEKDPSQDERDKYGRLLRFVWTDSGKTDFGAWMIANGYAYEYTYDTPHKQQTHYRELQKEAENTRRGLWSDATCNGETSQSINGKTDTKKKCSDFSTKQEAQTYFDTHGGSTASEVKSMDGNGDGQACETLP